MGPGQYFRCVLLTFPFLVHKIFNGKIVAHFISANKNVYHFENNITLVCHFVNFLAEKKNINLIVCQDQNTIINIETSI